MCMKYECKCEPKIVGHVHAELMKQYAEDAKETDKPWERWEQLCVDSVWRAFTCGHPTWRAEHTYRRKPRTHMVNGIEVPAPMRDAPLDGSRVWVSSPIYNDWASDMTWRGSSWQTQLLARGIFYTTKEAAVANAMAMIGRKVP